MAKRYRSRGEWRVSCESPLLAEAVPGVALAQIEV